ncbi:sensor histidine kinase [Pseudaestuariivita sp.]|uniref:sensor histidine kinase n=1 Tax=Pseudaestuariivita sp. TaxID=2211669 RepID=UPI004059B070
MLERSINTGDADALEGLEENPQGFAISLLSSTDDCIKVLDMDGRLTFMSCNGLAAMEIDDFEDVRGAPWPALWPEAQKELVARAVSQAQKGQTAEFEAICPTAKGTHRVWAVTVIPVLSGEGQVERIVATSRDVTERVGLERALQMRANDLNTELAAKEALLAERTHLLREMDHRVKNSLALVSTTLRLQERRASSEEVADALRSASARVLAVARVHEGLQAQVDDRTIYADTFLEALLTDMREALGEGRRIVLEAAPALELSPAQSVHLGLICVELIQNAAKHGNGDGPIAVTCAGDDDPAQIVFAVTDTGGRLPEAFDMARASGLGLQVCRSSAAMLGGTFGAAPGAVARFELRFPRAVAVAP